MLQIKQALAVTFCLFATIGNAQFTDVINSNRPGESMAAFSVGKTIFQAEVGIYGIRQKFDSENLESRGLGSELALRYGAFFEQLEFILELQYQRDRIETGGTHYIQNGLKQATIGGKFLIYDPNKHYQKKPNLYSWKANHSFSWREFIPAVGVYAGVNLNLFDNPYAFPNEETATPKAMILTQNQFGRWVLVGNFIVDKIISNYMSYGYIITVTRGINERWSGFLENQGTKSDFYSDMIFRGGAAFLIKENIQIDASIGANVKDTPSMLTAGIGLSWRFDDNYEDVILRAPGEKKSKEDKKKDKEKDKAKKRLDGIEGEEKTK